MPNKDKIARQAYQREYIKRPEVKKKASEYSKKRYKEDISFILKTKEKGIQLRIKQKNLVLEYYGKFCACCLEDNVEFLTIDHIGGGGNQHRKTISGTTYSWLIKNNYPDGFQTLCMNCNWAERFGKKCPHKNGRPDDKESKE